MSARDLDRDQPWARLPATLGMDPADALDRLIVERLGDVLAAIDPARLVPPVSSRTRRRYERTVLNFKRWCRHAGFTAELDEAPVLPAGELRLAVEEWLAWRVTDIEPSHPLSVESARSRGVLHECGWRTTEASSQPSSLRGAIRWWAAAAGLGEIVSARAELLEGAARAVRPARDLTDAEILAVVDALLDDAVVACVDESRRDAWQARQIAIFNISVAASLRQCELSMLEDRNVISIDAEGVRVQLPRTKRHPTGRLIHLRPRGDALCPVWALTRWLRLCADRSWPRGGLLLPAVVQRRVKALVPPNSEHERRAWRLVTDHLGITDDAESGLRATPHGLRAISLTRAVEAGWDPHDLLQLGDWAGLQTALRYDRAKAAPSAFVAAMGNDLASFGAIDGMR